MLRYARLVNTLVLDNERGVIALPLPGGQVWARVLEVGAVQPGFSSAQLRAAAAGAERIIIWSGSLGDSLFDDDPRTWSPRGWAALADACASISRDLAGSRCTVCFRTHARHVLSDLPSCARFARDLACYGPFQLLLDPASMLAESMLASAEDHLHRIFEGAAALPNLAGLLVSDALGPHVDLAVRLAAGHLPPVLPVIRGAGTPRRITPTPA